MMKSQIYRELYELQSKLEMTLDKKEQRKIKAEIFELNFILKHWKEEYEEDTEDYRRYF